MTLTLEAPPPQTLLVDDDATDRSRVREVLETAAFEVSSLPSYRGNVRSSAAAKDLVLLDRMVDGNDYRAGTVAKHLREEQPGRALMFLTSFPPAVDSEQFSLVSFSLQKTDEVWSRLPWLSCAAVLHDKGLYVLQQMAARLGPRQKMRNAAIVGGEDLFIELRRYYECLAFAVEQPWVEHETLTGWSGQLREDLGRVYEEEYFSPVDLCRLQPSLLDGVQLLQASLASSDGVSVREGLIKEVDELRAQLTAITDAVDIEAAESPTVRKYTDVDFPSTCIVGEETTLRMCIRDEGGLGELNLEFETDPIELMVIVSGDGFEIPNPNVKMSVPQKGDSAEIEFPIVPLVTGDQYLYVHFYRATADVGSLILHSTVKQRASERVRRGPGVGAAP
jgi:CheY-like chemotaxis protein